MTRAIVQVCILCVLILFHKVVLGQTDSIAKKAGLAIQLSNKYLEKQMPVKSHNNLILMHYLEKAYQVKYSVNISSLLIPAPVYDDEKAQMIFLRKLYGGKCNCSRSDIMQLNGLALMIALCINTEIVKPDIKLSELIWSLSGNEDRDLTHAAFGLSWLIEQHKADAVQHLDSLIKIQVGRLNSLAKKEDYSTDTGMEALVSLIRLGYSSEIKDEWVMKILEAQNADGGWAWLPADNYNSHEHPTILAQWILLNYMSSGKVYKTWLN